MEPIDERRPVRLAHYPCGCKTLALDEVSTVEFEMHLPKCEVYRKGVRECMRDYAAFGKFRVEHFASQTPEIDGCLDL